MDKNRAKSGSRSYENPNPIAKFLRKPCVSFKAEDLVKFVLANDVPMLNFNYVAADGRVKTLSFAIRDTEHLRRLLNVGERVDGSSLFKYVDPAKSDMYVIPRPDTAFMNPFSPLPTLNVLCAYTDAKGQPVDIAPENSVARAQEELKKKTGIELRALGELEYYIFLKPDQGSLFPSTPQRNYHESEPFAKMKALNEEALHTLNTMGIRAKYGHSEVGAITLEDGNKVEQYEIELDLEPIERAADNLVLAKWALRNIAAKHGNFLTFAPKLAVGHAGSGLHIHMAPFKGGRNLLVNRDMNLSDTAKKLIGGLMRLAPSLTAFGNTNPTSYLRLVPHQEAPTNVCWGDRNRSALVRVPLGWRNLKGGEVGRWQTIEIRSPDGSANVHLLLAGIGAAARHGFTSPESLKLAEQSYVNVNIFKEEHKEVRDRLGQLPASCADSAAILRKDAPIYEEGGVFSRRLIDGVAGQLEAFDDHKAGMSLRDNPAQAEKYVKAFLNCG